MVEQRSAQSWRSLPVLPWVVLAAGLLITYGLVRVVERLEEQVVRARIELEAEQRALAFGAQLSAAEDALHSVASLFASTEHEVTRAEFGGFLEGILARHPHIQAIGFDPLITREQRQAHEAEARRQGLTDYRITERARQGEMVPADARDVYYPVFYMEPRAGNEAAYGFDIGSEPRRLDAIRRARDTGRFAATAPITLVQEHEDELGFLGILERRVPEALALRPEDRMRGYVVGVYRMASLAEGGLAAFGRGVMTLAVLDLSEDGPQSLLEFEPGHPPGYDQVSKIDFGGRKYQLSFRPTRGFLRDQRTWVPRATLVVGLVSSAGVALFLLLLLRRTRRVEQLVALGQDELRQRQRAEESLRVSEERLELTLNAVSDGGWDWDIARGHVTFSDAWLRSFGYDRGEIPGQFSAWEALLHPDDVEQVRAAREEHLAGRTSIYECESRLRTRSGQFRHNLSRGKVVLRDASGAPLRMVGTDTDITRRKQEDAERARALSKLQQSQKLESLGVVVGGIAHDFNNLLAGILGNTELARRALPPPEVAACLEQIDKAGQRASELTSEMLAYAGRGTFELERLDLSVLAAELPQLVLAALSKKATLRKQLDGGQAWVRADPAQLRQVVMNLLINASDALEDKPGTISLSTGVVDLDRDDLAGAVLGKDCEPGRYAYVEVRDTGLGMSPEVQERVFDPFFSTKQGGRGLGLAAVIGIVRWHEGVVQLASEPGRGTTFRVLLPAVARPSRSATDAQQPQEPQAVAGASRLRGRVLVVDDEPDVRQITAIVLEEAGLEVLEAADGPAALATFQEQADSVDLVVTDMNMPGMSGTELTQAMRRVRPALPVIVVSGYAETEGLADLPGVRFLAKPYGFDTLLQTVREVLAEPGVPGGSDTPRGPIPA